MFENRVIRWRDPAAAGGFTAVFAGDCCPHQKGAELILGGKADSIVAGVKDFFAASDLRIIQWETPLSRSESPIDKCGPNLLAPPESTALLKCLGIDVALLANNHIGDHGPDVVMETIGHLASSGMGVAGAGRNLDAACAPLALERKGIRIALLNFAENEFGTAGRNKAGSAPLSPPANIGAIRAAKQGADLVFVAVHGGHEENPFPSPRMAETYRAFADAGASIVFNCHTHCPGGIEIRNGIPIVYSPGNFYFPWASDEPMDAPWWTGYLSRFHCDEKGAYALELMPYVFDNAAVHAIPPAKERKFFEYMEKLSAVLGDQGLVQKFFEAWCAQSGMAHLQMAGDSLKSAWPLDMSSRDNVRKWLLARNLFTCESHCDMMKQFFRLVEERRLDKAAALFPELAGFQSLPWMAR